ncbi:MAG: OmpA family protein [Bacteroidetes bacterium]|nr:OmpA family protein [Bacteroidota bacterium]
MKKYLVYILLGLPWFQPGAQGQDDTESLSCLDCHESLVLKQVVHAPVTESCDYCHTATGNEHPAEQQKGFTLSESMPDLCYICHDTYNEGNVHAPIEAGECAICHSPHSSSFDHLLVARTDHLCFECHESEIMEKKIIHQPVQQGNCQACHNPHHSSEPSLLIKGRPALCFTCHEKTAQQITEEFIHPPFEDDCMNCHSPHSSEEGQLMDLPGNGLCFECHDDIRESIESSHVIHKVINEDGGCAQCHSAHASSNPKYLLDKPTELCLSCHNKSITTSTRKLSNIRQKLDEDHFVHGAIEFDGCAGCHTAHFSEFPSLLTDAYPEGNYTEGKSERFALCFNCHDQEIIEVEKSTSISNFRNGEINLHFLHIHGVKARSCGTCHDMHGSAYDHLIAEEVVFGNWNMPVIFKVNINGGSCFTGCHNEKKYDRVNAVNNSLKNEQVPLKKIEKYVTINEDMQGDSIPSKKFVASTFNLEFKQLEEEFNHLHIPPIYFNSRKTTMAEGAEGVLRMIIDFLNDHPESKILLEGHADKFSEKVYDHALSKKRADRVKSIILSFGIENDRVEIVGYGISKPATTENNKKGRQLNRRVEVSLLKK